MAAELQKAGVAFIQGELKMVGAVKSVIDVAGEPRTVEYKKCILATGSRPAAHPGLKADHEAILNSGDILSLREVPKHLLVVGAGFIGLELAQFFSRVGSKITLIEVAPRIAPSEDEEISKALAQSFKRMGWDMHVRRGHFRAGIRRRPGPPDLERRARDHRGQVPAGGRPASQLAQPHAGNARSRGQGLGMDTYRRAPSGHPPPCTPWAT